MSESDGDRDVVSPRKQWRRSREVPPIFESDSDIEEPRKARPAAKQPQNDKFESLLKLSVTDGPDERSELAKGGGATSGRKAAGTESASKQAKSSNGTSNRKHGPAGNEVHSDDQRDNAEQSHPDTAMDEDEAGPTPLGRETTPTSPSVGKSPSRGKKRGRHASPEFPRISKDDDDDDDDDEEEIVPLAKRVSFGRPVKGSCPPSDAEGATAASKRSTAGGVRQSAAAAAAAAATAPDAGKSTSVIRKGRGRPRKGENSAGNEKAGAAKGGKNEAGASVERTSDVELKDRQKDDDEESKQGDGGSGDDGEGLPEDEVQSKAGADGRKRRGAWRRHKAGASPEKDLGAGNKESSRNTEDGRRKANKAAKATSGARATRGRLLGNKAASIREEEDDEEPAKAERGQGDRDAGEGSNSGDSSEENKKEEAGASEEPRRSARARKAKSGPNDEDSSSDRTTPDRSDNEAFTMHSTLSPRWKKARKSRRLTKPKGSARRKLPAKSRGNTRTANSSDDEGAPLFSRGGTMVTAIKQLVIAITRTTSMMGDLAAEISRLRETAREVRFS